MIKIIAHRGASLKYPENTFLAFDRAVSAGAQAIETDLRMSADGRIVLCHDDFVDYHGERKPISSLSFKQLQSLSLGRRQRIPEFEDFLDTYGGRIPLILEIKETGLAEPVSRCLKVRRLDDSCEVTSFYLSELLNMKKLRPHVPLSLALSAMPEPLAAVLLEEGIRTVSLQRSFVSRAVVRFLKQRGMSVRVYAVNSSEEAARLFRWGVRSIFTDDPGRMQQFISSRK